MKKAFLLIISLCFSYMIYAEHFVMLPVASQQNLEQMFQRKDITVHYYNDEYILATAEKMSEEMVLLDNEAFATSDVYYILYCAAANQRAYLEKTGNTMNILFSNDNFMIVKPLNGEIKPAKNDGVVAVFNKKAKLPVQHRDFPVVTEENSDIRYMMELVNIDSIRATVQFMQDFGSRIYNSTQAYQTSEWIQAKFEALNLEVETQDVTYSGSQCAPNVIAIQRGTLYPDEYVVCGSHFDSFSYSGNCPGADDNATGVASVLETARILSQYQFDRSIIYCAFTCEEMGLYGSAAYASRCAQQNMNIIGYFNNDMNGYLYGNDIHIDCIYPSSVEPIGVYYRNIGEIYFPEMEVRHESFMSGDSDHTSFNNNGYMGIYPFEDNEHYSPYIHSPGDTIGTSVNSWEMSQRYCQMNMGCLTEIANPQPRGPIVYNNCVIDDSEGNGDGKMNPGETISLTITMENKFDYAVDDVNVTLSTENEYITLNNTTANFGDFAAGEIVTLENAFSFTISNDALVNCNISFNLEAVSGSESCSSRFKIVSYGNILNFVSFLIDDEDGVLSPGETTNMLLYVNNIGNELAKDVIGNLSSTSNEVTINEPEGNFGTIGAGLTNYAVYSVSLSDNATSTELPFAMTLTDGNGNITNIEFSYRNSCNILFKLSDSYGDGWNGASITVSFDDGTPSQNISCQGHSQDHTFEVAFGTTVSMEWNSGQYDSECSYEVQYEGGNQIYSGEDSQNGVFFSWFNDCFSNGEAPVICDEISDLQAEINDGDITLTWTVPASGTPIRYDVYRETILLGNTTETTYYDGEVGNGTYEYCVYAVYDECNSIFSCIDVETTLDIEENAISEIEIYPNPAYDKVTVKSGDMSRIDVYNIFGQRVCSLHEAEEAVLSTENWGAGMYIFKITNNLGETFIRKIEVK